MPSVPLAHTPRWTSVTSPDESSRLRMCRVADEDKAAVVRDVQPLLKHLHGEHHTGVLNNPFDHTLNDRRARTEIPAFLRHGFCLPITN